MPEKLKQARENAGLKQAGVSEALDISRGQLSKYETGAVIPRSDVLAKLAGLYRVSTDYLLGLENKKTINVDGLSLDQIAYLEQGAALFRNSNS